MCFLKASVCLSIHLTSNTSLITAIAFKICSAMLVLLPILKKLFKCLANPCEGKYNGSEAPCFQSRIQAPHSFTRTPFWNWMSHPSVSLCFGSSWNCSKQMGFSWQMRIYSSGKQQRYLSDDIGHGTWDIGFGCPVLDEPRLRVNPSTL